MIRIVRLDLLRWGHFQNVSLTFGALGRLQLVYGDNEAGKSTTGRAINALLLGVPETTRDAFLHSYRDLRIGALLELDGRPVEVRRRKGRKNTLLDADDQPVDETELVAALGGVSAEVYSGLFHIDHDTLVEGGHELALGEGAVGEALFSAASGRQHLHELLRRLEDEAEQIFTPRGGVRKKLNKALGEHREAAKAIREATLRPQEVEARRAKLEELERRHAELADAVAKRELELRRLQRVQRALPLVSRHKARADELAALGDVPELAADDIERRRERQAERDRLLEAARAAERERERQQTALAELEVDERLAAQAERIRALRSRSEAVAEESERRAELGRELERERAALEQATAALAPAFGGRPPERLAVDERTREALLACVNEGAEVDAELRSATDAAEEAQRRREDAAAALDRAGEPSDPAALEAALRAARNVLGAEEAASRHRAAAEFARHRADEAAARMSPSPGDADALRRLPVPAVDAVRALALRDAELRAAADELAAERERLSTRVAELERERAALGDGGELPDEAALAAAREERAALWSEVRGRLMAPKAGDPALADRFERAVRAADELADRRFAHADALARLRAVERDRARLEADRGALERRAAEHAQAAGRHAEEWVELWGEAADAAPSPAVAEAWLQQRAAALALLDDADREREQAEAAAAQVARHRAELAEELRRCGTRPADDATLAALIELAEARVGELRAEVERHARAAEELERAERAHGEQQRRLDAARRRHEEWTERWRALRDAVGLDKGLAPAAAHDALLRIADAAARRQRVDDLSAQLEAIDARAEALARDVAELVAAAAPDLADLARRAPAAAVAELDARLDRTLKAAAQRDKIEADIRRLAGEEAEARARAEEAQAVLDELCSKAGAADVDELLELERRSEHARELRAELHDLEEQIAVAGERAPDEVIAEVRDENPDEVRARVGTLEDELAGLRDEQQRLAGDVKVARAELERIERSDEAAAAAQRAAVLQAEIRELAERWARARLGRRILRDAIERYRAQHEGPLLRRADELFTTLTGGRFAALLTELDDNDRPVLIAQAADGRRLKVDELSDGTREQLFLALRLAAIERHIETSGPLPVVFDDVLLESDDRRAAEVLRALADLAGRTQVIVLTHHRHLIGVAAQAIGGRFDVIELRPDGAEHAEAPTTAGAEPRVTIG